MLKFEIIGGWGPPQKYINWHLCLPYLVGHDSRYLPSLSLLVCDQSSINQAVSGNINMNIGFRYIIVIPKAVETVKPTT